MKNKNINCPICGNKKISELSQVLVYNYCDFCRTAWLKRPTKTFYGEKYYQGKSSIFSNLFKPLALFFYWVRKGYIGFDKKKLWVDVGAGEGSFLKTVKAERRIGVEISKAGRELITKKGLQSMPPEEFLSSQNLKTSVISFWHVLEHTVDPWDYLKVAHHNLDKNGKIIIGVPNMESWEFKTFGKNWFHLVPDYHLWHFSAISMQKLLEKNGFKIDKIDWWSPEHHPTGLLQSFINQSSGTYNFLHKLIKRKTDIGKINSKAVFWIIFWLSLGLPIVLFIWIVNSLLKKSGAFVIVASKK